MSKIIPFDKSKRDQDNQAKIVSTTTGEQQRYRDIEKRLIKINKLMQELRLMVRLTEEIKL